MRSVPADYFIGSSLHAARRLGILAVALAIAGCAARNKAPVAPLSAPAVFSQANNFAGTPLSGPLAVDVASISTADSLAVKVTFIALEKMPVTADPPLGRIVRLIVATREGSPVLPSARLTLGVRIREVDHAASVLADLNAGKYGRWALISTQQSALLRGSTAAFGLDDRQGPPDLIPGRIAGRQLQLEFYRSSASPKSASTQPTTAKSSPAPDSLLIPESRLVQASLLLNDFINPAPLPGLAGAYAARPSPGPRRNLLPVPAPATQPLPPPIYQTELALFDRRGQPDAFALFIPITFQNAQSQAVLTVVEILPAASESTQQKYVDRAIQDIRAASDQAARQAKPARADSSDWPGLSSAVESLVWSDRQRAGLAYLANQTDSSLTLDIALTANETILSRLAQLVSSAIDANPDARDRSSVGWLLDRTTLQLILQIQAANQLPLELQAILALRAGEAGRHLERLAEILSHAAGQQDFQNRLAAENYIFLEDSSPAARARAFDWLNSRKLAPAGYDPLASPKERRAALEQAQQAAASPPAAQ